MSGTVLVTGGSGYIGGYLIQQLIREGWTVHTTIRSLAREAEVRATLDIPGPELKFFAADLMNDAGWAEAMAGCTHVAHVASPFPVGAVKHEDELIVPAREGALRALRFAKEAGVQRFVQTSSVAAIAYGRDDLARPFTEADWTDVTSPKVAAYPKSKTIAERVSRDWIAANGGAMEYCSVNPAAVLGPVQSADYSASIEFVKRAIDGSVPGFPRLGFAVVDVRDLADLHVRALTTPGIANERFIAAGPFMMMKEVGQVLRDRLGPDAKKVPKRVIPDFLVRFIALFDGGLRQVIGELGRVRAVDSSHALEVLGWKTRPAADSIVDTARSLIDRGIVKV
ncbi:NAD-dependent epimerase/dehydratase family protein [Sphingomonas alpina]|uniref:NAD-dependent epimerase/dehydratase family protein n=1 Tax=Sphingomonas alpina TaxID=653931 RepID=A0A7H0LE21_9SPHN|nr:NAD-dependent epimerase/dehydratase family protein [Sphingomonas alpina]QNQ07924.1 NAD-dependent epimerase/dehydratase family protein [Sphingomonas alpina]